MQQENTLPDMVVLEAEDRELTEAENKREAKQKLEAKRLRRLKILFPFLLVLVLLVYAFTTNFIPSESMLPGLKPGDHTLTMRSWIAYPGGRMPARGDIVVFNLPPEQAKIADPEYKDEEPGRRTIGVFRTPPGEILIKRVVGLPGDTIEIREGVVYLNGKKFQPDYPIIAADPDFDQTYIFGVVTPVKVGPDEVFLLGDNGRNSDDARFWGPLKQKNILGKFICVLFHEGENGPNEKKEKAAREAENAANNGGQ